MLWFSNIYLWFKFYFFLVLGMVMYDNDFERKTKVNRNKKITATYI